MSDHCASIAAVIRARIAAAFAATIAVAILATIPETDATIASASADASVKVPLLATV